MNDCNDSTAPKTIAAQIDVLFLQLDFAATDSGHVQQLVDEAGHQANLPVHHSPYFLHLLGVFVDHRPKLKCIADGCQRVPQLVSQDRQKVVFLPTGLQQCLGPLRENGCQACLFALVSPRQPG